MHAALADVIVASTARNHGAGTDPLNAALTSFTGAMSRT